MEIGGYMLEMQFWIIFDQIFALSNKYLEWKKTLAVLISMGKKNPKLRNSFNSDELQKGSEVSMGGMLKSWWAKNVSPLDLMG